MREDLVEGGFDDLIADRRLDARTQGEFETLRTDLGRELFGAAMARQKLAEPIIEAQAELKPWMDPPLMGFAKASYDDLREQLAGLMQPGFLRELPAGPARPLPALPQGHAPARRAPAPGPGTRPVAYAAGAAVLARVAQCGRHRARVTKPGDELRWLLEEWRVSLFAQELKTAEPVSAKRLARALDVAQAAAR